MMSSPRRAVARYFSIGRRFNILLCIGVIVMLVIGSLLHRRHKPKQDNTEMERTDMEQHGADSTERTYHVGSQWNTEEDFSTIIATPTTESTSTVRSDVGYPGDVLENDVSDGDSDEGIIEDDGMQRNIVVKTNSKHTKQTETGKTKDVSVKKFKKGRVCPRRNLFSLEGSATERILKWNTSTNFEPESIQWFLGKLKPNDHPVVPNIAHFTWVGCPDFEFYNLISIVSVYRTMKPDRMLFHTDCDPEPQGYWWNEAKRIPVLEIVHHETPESIFGIKIRIINHKSDVLRLQALLQYGGVYFDLDIWLFKPFESLRYYDYVANRPGDGRLSNNVILANKNSEYLRMYYESYRNFQPRCFACTSVWDANNMAFKHRDLLHIELFSFNRNINHCDDWVMEYFSPMDWDLPRYSIHFYHKQTVANRQPLPNSENIKTMNNTVGEIARYIYYGTKDVITDDTWTIWHRLDV